MQNWVEWLRETNRLVENAKENKTTYLDELTIEYNILPETASEIAKGLFRNDGNYNKLSRAGKKDFIEIVKSEGYLSEKLQTSITHATSLIDFKVPLGIQRAVLPAYYIMQKFGGTAGKKIAEKIIQFDVIANNL